MRVVGLTLTGFLGLILLAKGWPVDLLLVGTVLAGLLYGSRYGGVVGLVFGAAQDLLVGRYPGLHLLTKTMIGFAAGRAERSFFRENPFLPALAVSLATLVQHLAYGLGGEMIAWGRSFWPPVIPWWEVLANTLVGMMVYWFLSSRVRRR